jgi:hypothetical protein
MRSEIARRLCAFHINLPDIDQLKEHLLRTQMGGGMHFFTEHDAMEDEATAPIELEE